MKNMLYAGGLVFLACPILNTRDVVKEKYVPSWKELSVPLLRVIKTSTFLKEFFSSCWLNIVNLA